MAKVEIDDPELYSTKTTDKQGRLYIGKKYADKDVEFIIIDSGDGVSESKASEVGDVTG